MLERSPGEEKDNGGGKVNYCGEGRDSIGPYRDEDDGQNYDVKIPRHQSSPRPDNPIGRAKRRASSAIAR